MHMCVRIFIYNTKYDYIRVARFNLATVVTIVALFVLRKNKDSNIEYDSHGYWMWCLHEVYVEAEEKDEPRAYSTTSITGWQGSNTRNLCLWLYDLKGYFIEHN
jgi:hypothetical protein